jgi:hypothetical protein
VWNLTIHLILVVARLEELKIIASLTGQVKPSEEGNSSKIQEALRKGAKLVSYEEKIPT